MKNKRAIQLIILIINTLYSSLTQARQNSLPETTYKYYVAQQVCQQLAIAFGEPRLPKLTMITDPDSHRIAQFVPKPEPELFLDEKLYDICRGFGADSLAALSIVLGHELAHYYGKHADWFGFAQLIKHQQPTLAQAQQTQVLEAQADMQGVYRAFLAGYDTYRLVKPLYIAIYATYHLPVRMSGYPSREERIQMIDEQARKANTLGIAFETGLFFFLKRDYPVAQRCFDFVSGEMPTKELLNNIGLCQVLRATQAMTLRDMPFRYPFELETGNRLRQDDHRGDGVNKTDLLKRAISYFRQAIDVDETYATAYINLAAALSMLGRMGTAKETIDQLEEVLRQTNEPLPPNARMIRGIALIEAGRSTDGIAELERSKGAYELTYNQAVAREYDQLNKQSSQTTSEALMTLANRYAAVPLPSRPLLPETRYGAIRLPFTNTIAFTERLAIPEPGFVRIQSSHTDDGTLYRIGLADVSYAIICSQPGRSVQSARGVKSGDSVQLLTTQYGEPNRIVPTANGLLYYCYDSANFFVAIRSGAVKNWFIYTAQ